MVDGLNKLFFEKCDFGFLLYKMELSSPEKGGLKRGTNVGAYKPWKTNYNPPKLLSPSFSTPHRYPHA